MIGLSVGFLVAGVGGGAGGGVVAVDVVVLLPGALKTQTMLPLFSSFIAVCSFSSFFSRFIFF